MSSRHRQVQVVFDGRMVGQIRVDGELSFRSLAEAVCEVPEMMTLLKRHGVAGCGFDGSNFYITSPKRAPKSFSPNFQWFLTPMGGSGQGKLEFGSNPFEDLL